MHEAGIAAGIMTSAIDAAGKAGGSRIVTVDVTIGVLTEVLEDALQFAWDAAIVDTIAEGSTLAVTMIPARSRCLDCGHEFGHGRYDGTRCPSCEGYVVELVTGRELVIDGIDID
ncbi:MAG: hydrogenase maturation nickel metallochaperone HypA [Coriobacteriia bacterium]|nr:hydrogenase maturation nickel metallochaperone HypA [Coriobacteriia bacterium]